MPSLGLLLHKRGATENICRAEPRTRTISRLLDFEQHGLAVIIGDFPAGDIDQLADELRGRHVETRGSVEPQDRLAHAHSSHTIIFPPLMAELTRAGPPTSQETVSTCSCVSRPTIRRAEGKKSTHTRSKTGRSFAGFPGTRAPRTARCNLPSSVTTPCSMLGGPVTLATSRISTPSLLKWLAVPSEPHSTQPRF